MRTISSPRMQLRPRRRFCIIHCRLAACRPADARQWGRTDCERQSCIAITACTHMTTELVSQVCASMPTCTSQWRERLTVWGSARADLVVAELAAAQELGHGVLLGRARLVRPGRRPLARLEEPHLPPARRARAALACTPRLHAGVIRGHCLRRCHLARCSLSQGSLWFLSARPDLKTMQTVPDAATPTLGTDALPMPCHAAHRPANKQPPLSHAHPVLVRGERGGGLPVRLRVRQLAPLSHRRPTSACGDKLLGAYCWLARDSALDHL